MVTGQNGMMLNEIEFERQIKAMADRDLQEFTARQIFGICKRCERHDKRISNLESIDRQMILKGSGVGAGAFGLVYGIIELIKRFSGGG